MPRLLQINVCYGYYSTGKIAESISEIVKSHGWESYVAYRNDVPSKNSALLLPIGNRWDKYFHFAYSFLFDKHCLGSKRATAKLIDKIERINPDIIQLHNIHGYYLNIKILFDYLSVKGYPIVITTHDCWLFTGHCSHFAKISCEKWLTGCYDCPLKSSYPKSIKDNSSYNYSLKKDLFSKLNNLHIITVSQWLADVVNKSFIKDNNVRVIHNGIDTSRFRILEEKVNIPNIDTEKKLVMAVSSAWYEDKGLYDYYTLSEILPADIIICLVGLSEYQIKQLPKKIMGISRTSSIDELVKLYNRANVILSLSKSETFGLTIVEGFACGTPAIVYDNTALPELISESTGLVVPNGDVNAVKNAIVQILSKVKKEYSDSCRQAAISRYNEKTCFNEYYKLYEEILKNENI